jgi:hypothetical protein
MYLSNHAKMNHKAILVWYALLLFFSIFFKYFGKIAHNVPAVYDVLPARIRASRSIVPQERDQGCKNVGGVNRGSVATQANVTPERPKGAEHIQACYVPFFALYTYI